MGVVVSVQFVSHDGTVYADGDILHRDSVRCSHAGVNACPVCDFDRYYAHKHREVCPWFNEDE